jgi:hypothetical protein
VLENSETRFKLVVPKKINTKSNTTKAKQTIAFLLIFLYPPFWNAWANGVYSKGKTDSGRSRRALKYDCSIDR